MSDKLKPCPFCGDNNDYGESDVVRLVGKPGDIWVMCSNCDDLLVGSFETPGYAIAAWNRRPQ